MCGRHDVASKLPKDYVGDRVACYVLVIEKVNGDPARCASPNTDPVTRVDIKKLFIYLLYQGGSGPWYKEHHFESNIRKIEDLKPELKRIDRKIVREYPDLHNNVKVLHGDTERFQEKDLIARTISLV